MNVSGLWARPPWYRPFKLARWCREAERYALYLHDRLAPYEAARHEKEAAEFFSWAPSDSQFADGTWGFEAVTVQKPLTAEVDDVVYRSRNDLPAPSPDDQEGWSGPAQFKSTDSGAPGFFYDEMMKQAKSLNDLGWECKKLTTEEVEKIYPTVTRPADWRDRG